MSVIVQMMSEIVKMQIGPKQNHEDKKFYCHTLKILCQTPIKFTGHLHEDKSFYRYPLKLHDHKEKIYYSYTNNVVSNY